MPQFIATLRAVYDAADEVEAIYIAEQIRDNGAKDLEEDEGDTLSVTQVTNNTLDILPQEVVSELRKARNLLIRTRIRDCLDVAQALDKVLFSIYHREDPRYAGGAYSYGDFMEIVGQVLKGESPNDR